MEREPDEREEDLIFDEEEDEDVPEDGVVDLTYLQQIRCHP